MSFLDRLRRKSLTADPAVISALRGGTWSPGPTLGGTNVQAIIERWAQAQSATYGYMYRTQPAVRKVVHKIAENLSQMCPKLYEQVDENERQPAFDEPAALTLRYPNPDTPADRFIYDLVADYLVYDNAYVLEFPGANSGFAANLYRWPVHLVVALGSGIVTTGYRLYNLDGSAEDYDTDQIMHWRGYNPDDPRIGVAPLETLRQILAEDAASQAATTELAKNGLKGGHIERPIEAPEWDKQAADRFVQAWAKMAKQSPRQTPVLEEGMTFVNDAISPVDAELLAGRQFTTDEVADVYGIPRGIFSDHVTEEDRTVLYADVIAPLSKKLASVLDHSVVQGIFGETDFCFEFDMNEKLRGSPETRFPANTSAAGRPWLTVNEVRERESLPPLEGGDELTLPLNVELLDENGEPINPNPTTPQLPAPNVMPPQDPNGNPADGSYRENPKQLTTGKAASQIHPRRKADMNRQKRYIDEATAVLERFYRRQARTVKSAKSFDSGRWDKELADDLQKVISSIVEREGGVFAARFAQPDFDMRNVQHYIQSQSEGMATEMNAATQRNLEDMTAGDAIDRAIGTRAAIAGASVGTKAAVFARQEAGRRSGRQMQTWVADTDRHADLDGVSVPIDSDWGGIEPGSEPNCACGVDIS